ncbi:hypothetical protein ABTN12_19755, partial [Acinetobacter baumannii]
ERADLYNLPLCLERTHRRTILSPFGRDENSTDQLNFRLAHVPKSPHRTRGLIMGTTRRPPLDLLDLATGYQRAKTLF